MSPSRPSATALLIAHCLVLVSSEPALARHVPLSQRTMAIACLAAAGRAGAWETWCARRWFRRLMWAVERLTLPGFALHLALRKRRIADWIDGAIALGACQVLVIGAGCDALAARVALRHAHVRCFELDHPATQAVKRAAMPAAVRLVPVDLTTMPLRATLEAAGWDPRQRSAMVVEGVLMYLDEPSATELLQTLANCAAVGSRLAATAMSACRFTGAPGWIGRWLRLVGEPFRWHLPPTGLEACLERSGWKLRELADHRQLARMLGSAPRALARGEYLAWAERA